MSYNTAVNQRINALMACVCTCSGMVKKGDVIRYLSEQNGQDAATQIRLCYQILPSVTPEVVSSAAILTRVSPALAMIICREEIDEVMGLEPDVTQSYPPLDVNLTVVDPGEFHGLPSDPDNEWGKNPGWRDPDKILDLIKAQTITVESPDGARYNIISGTLTLPPVTVNGVLGPHFVSDIIDEIEAKGKARSH